MSTFALFLRPHGARDVAAEVATWLTEREHEVRLLDDDAAAIGRPELGVADDELVLGADVVVSLGGDGTMLRAAALAAPEDVPVLGVNLGELGYLTAVEPSGAKVALKRFLSGSYEIEERMRLDVVAANPAAADGAPADVSALNEVVIEKSGSGQAVRLDVDLDGRAFTSYVADGLILATATGSTAYSFSVRGPILDPRLRAVVLTPVAAHMLFDRSMVLGPDCALSARLVSDRAANVIVDGREMFRLESGDAMLCRPARRPTRLVTFGGRDFHSVLRSKLALEDR